MTAEQKPSPTSKLFACFEAIAALPAEALRRLVLLWKGYLIRADDPAHRAQIAADGKALVKAFRRGDTKPPRLMADIGADIGPAHFDQATTEALVAVDELLMWMPREEQRFLMTLAAFVNSQPTPEDRELARFMLEFWADARTPVR